MSTLLTSPHKSADKFQEQMLPPLSAIILAGGEGRRMGGADKGLVEYQGKPLVQWVKEALPDHVDQVVISCNRNEAIYAAYGQTVHDLPSRETYAGALAGILAALEACTHDWVIITPCDLIYYPTHFAKYAWAALTAHQKIDPNTSRIVVAHDGERRQNLCLLVHKDERASIQEALKTSHAVHHWLESRKAFVIQWHDKQAFVNVNDPAQLSALDTK
ncbi:molybdenum cofactor guanylyltransferase MobA [Aquirhabdus parva]|uniref:Molybdenum cofactor guanylyltransferase n=1 Tax=Aquirhabdus parva TaxID=2283318 RepID=A0A345P323_9GAMM|nr:molybdenum cofactor guanylyltransferase MobA [Aquirhabdus parva]AXI01682.1 molybdenum cofactor guanylyltransferase [Aquirhabdus parva]